MQSLHPRQSFSNIVSRSSAFFGQGSGAYFLDGTNWSSGDDHVICHQWCFIFLPAFAHFGWYWPLLGVRRWSFFRWKRQWMLRSCLSTYVVFAPTILVAIFRCETRCHVQRRHFCWPDQSHAQWHWCEHAPAWEADQASLPEQ